MNDCQFCALSDEKYFLNAPLVRALWDRDPTSPGQVTISTRRHVADWFDASVEERHSLLDVLDAVRVHIEARYAPTGFSLAVNIGMVAGPIVPHLCVQVFPRYISAPSKSLDAEARWVADEAISLDGPLADGAPHNRNLIVGGNDPFRAHLAALLDRAASVDIAVAFTMDSGVRLVEEYLRDVLTRGGRLRFLTGDYLGVSEPDALLRLLDLGASAELRVYESAGSSFHPKSYIIHSEDGGGTAFVGSSNLSRSALTSGIEWNYRVVNSKDGDGFRDVCQSFDALLHGQKTRVLDAEWIANYRDRRQPAIPLLTGIPEELPSVAPPPNSVQLEALQALADTRTAGNNAGLVVLATGLGKTCLSAFDTEQAHAGRVLFVAHREEILDQAMRTYRTIRVGATLGKYTSTEKTPTADVLFASIQTLGRQTLLNRFAADHFDYVVIDEFHHASAATYLRLLDHFTPRFLLGLTATPERSDGADLLSLCGGNLVFRCDMTEGVRRNLLAPFDYYGVPDEVDYENIPWRSSRFDEEALTTAVATRTRAENALDQHRKRGGSRTLAFCVSQRHADFMREFFRAAGMRVAAVHSGATSDPRAHSLERLQRGELDVVFAVDMFNEGVDVPDVDSLLMLRPTESQILWLQQFGRGLRVRPEKRLKVIDYIGNHRSFLIKPRTLFQLGAGDNEISYALKLIEEGRGEEMLPPGCSVTYDLEAKEILRGLLAPTAGRDALVAYYTNFRDRTGARPTASEAYNDGYDPKAARAGYGSWHQFVRAMGDLVDPANDAEIRLRSFLTQLEITPITKSYKLLVLLAMIAEDAFPGALPIDTLTSRVGTIAKRSAILRTELADVLDDAGQLRELLETSAIDAWTSGRGTGGELFFKYDGVGFSSTIALPIEAQAAGTDMVREIAEWRLANYLRRTGPAEGAPRIVCKVSHSGGRPLLFLPSRDRVAGIPSGWIEVTADAERYQANFVKIAVNVLTHGASELNALPDLLIKWFGPGAGQPGSAHTVIFERTGEGYSLSPAGETALRRPQL